MRITGVALTVVLAACGPASGNGETAKASSPPISAAKLNDCRPVLADLAESQCVARVTEATLQRPGVLRSTLTGPTTAARQKLDGLIASVRGSACSSYLDPGLELGVDSAMAAGANVGDSGVVCRSDGCDAASAVAEMIRLCSAYRVRASEQYCAANGCKLGGETPARSSPAPIPDTSISLKKLDLPFYVAALDFSVTKDGIVRPAGPDKSTVVRVTISCERIELKRAATITIENTAFADQYFKDDASADLSPSVGTWELLGSKKSPSLVGVVYDAEVDFLNKPDRVANFSTILAALEAMRKTHTVKVGRLPPISFTDPEDQLGYMLTTCWRS